MGMLCGVRPVAGLFQLSPRPAADHPVGADAAVRSAPVGAAWPCHRHRGVDQLVAGLGRIGIGGLADADGAATTTGIVVALLVIMGLSTLSALSGVGKGIKWLSNINMVLSIILLGFLIIFGATWFGFNAMFTGLWHYVVALPQMSVNVFRSDGVEGSEAFLLAQWQGWWPVFYWAWWIAFAPFVGMFIWRGSRAGGRCGNSCWAR